MAESARMGIITVCPECNKRVNPFVMDFKTGLVKCPRPECEHQWIFFETQLH
jgi:hypothetical protein